MNVSDATKPDQAGEALPVVEASKFVVKDETGAEESFDLWTACYTPRELRLIAEQAGLIASLGRWASIARAGWPQPARPNRCAPPS